MEDTDYLLSNIKQFEDAPWLIKIVFDGITCISIANIILSVKLIVYQRPPLNSLHIVVMCIPFVTLDDTNNEVWYACIYIKD